MADHVVCVSVRIKNHNNNLENLISKRIGRFNHKLTVWKTLFVFSFIAILGLFTKKVDGSLI